MVSLVVPRPLITQSVESFFKHAKLGNFNARWVVHVDPVESMASDLPACLAEIDRLKKMFDEYDIVVSPQRIGHGQSFLNAMSRCQSGCIYFEDDKVFVADVDFNRIVRTRVDYMELDSRSSAINTTSAYWGAKLVRYMVDRKHLYKGGDIEQWLKTQYLGNKSNFRKGMGRHFSMDIGVKSLDDRGLVRKVDAHGNLHYIKRPDVTIVLWKHLGYPFQAYQEQRQWLLGDGYETICLEENQPVNWDSISTSHVMLLSTAVKFVAFCRHLLFFDFIDRGEGFFGFPDDAKKPYFLVGKTEILRSIAGEGKMALEVVNTTWEHPEIRHTGGGIAGRYGLVLMTERCKPPAMPLQP